MSSGITACDLILALSYPELISWLPRRTFGYRVPRFGGGRVKPEQLVGGRVDSPWQISRSCPRSDPLRRTRWRLEQRFGDSCHRAAIMRWPSFLAQQNSVL